MIHICTMSQLSWCSTSWLCSRASHLWILPFFHDITIAKTTTALIMVAKQWHCLQTRCSGTHWPPNILASGWPVPTGGCVSSKFVQCPSHLAARRPDCVPEYCCHWGHHCFAILYNSQINDYLDNLSKTMATSRIAMLGTGLPPNVLALGWPIIPSVLPACGCIEFEFFQFPDGLVAHCPDCVPELRFHWGCNCFTIIR